MSSKEFWEEDPSIYWAYRFSYIKELEMKNKIEIENARFICWLQGKANEVAYSVALHNAFSKKPIQYPTYDEFYGEKSIKQDNKIKEDLSKELKGIKDKELRGQIEYNYWARL